MCLELYTVYHLLKQQLWASIISPTAILFNLYQFAALEKRKKYMEDFRKVVQQKKTVNTRFARFNNIGIPRSGKSTFWKRLTGKDVDFSDGEKQNPSTGAAEYHSQIVYEDDIKDASVEMCLMPMEGTVWSELDHAREVSMIKQIFSDMGSDSSASKVRAATIRKPDAFIDTKAEVSEPEDSKPKRNAPTKVPEDLTDDPTKVPEDCIPKRKDSTRDHEADDMLEIFSILDKAQESTAEDWDDSQFKYQLEKIILLSSTDTGGHAEFQDMHASLISGPSFNLLFHRLYDNLNERFKVYFTKEDKTSTNAIPSDATVKEVLFQALSSIACFGNFCAGESEEEAGISEVEKALNSFQSRGMFVGTFLDKLNDREAGFKKKDQELRDMIKNTIFDKKIIREAKNGQLMFAIGKDCGMDMNEARTILRRELKDFCKPLPIPASWLVLSLCLRLHHSPTMSLEECKILARKLKIDTEKELYFALWFLHHGVGVLHYYSEDEVPEVKDIVFCRAQVVYNCVTKIIAAYGFDKVNKAYADFRNTGIFSLKDIKEDEEYASVPLRKFVKILEYLNIVAARPPVEEEKYFMPCVLESLPEERLKLEHRNPNDPPSLMLRYQCGYSPVGVFPALITNLVSRQDELNWEFMDDEKAFKNNVHFRLLESFDDLYLISHLRCFEIIISRGDNISDPSIETVCGMIHKIITSTLEQVILKMHYKFTMESEFGFRCPHSDSSHVHPAIPKNLKFMVCSENKKNYWPITDHHRIWLLQGRRSFACLIAIVCIIIIIIAIINLQQIATIPTNLFHVPAS